jgi:hypothetical protein
VYCVPISLKHGYCMTTAPRRRPRRSNSLKDIGRLLSTASTTYEDRKGRLEVHSAKLNNTDGNAHSNYFKIQTANLFLRQFGVQLIANDRAFHIYEEWPGMDRRLISGSVFTQTKLFFSSGGIGAAWLDDGPAGNALRHLKHQALDLGAPVPLYRQRLTPSGYKKERFEKYGTLGGATDAELKRATETKAKLNAAIMALREANPEFLKSCEAEEDKPRQLARELYRLLEIWDQAAGPDLKSPTMRPLSSGLLIPARNSTEAGSIVRLFGDDDDLPALSPPTKITIRDENGVCWRGVRHPLLGPVGRWTRIGKFGAASECRRLNPSTPIEIRRARRFKFFEEPDERWTAPRDQYNGFDGRWQPIRRGGKQRAALPRDLPRDLKMTGLSYIRSLDGAQMVEIRPGYFLNDASRMALAIPGPVQIAA